MAVFYLSGSRESKLTVSVHLLAILFAGSKIPQKLFDPGHKTKKAQENLDFIHFVGEPDRPDGHKVHLFPFSHK